MVNYPLEQTCARLREGFTDIKTRLVESSVDAGDERVAIYSRFLAQLNDGAFELLNYLELQALQRGIQNLAPAQTTAT